jgi:hypothetical protein
MRIKKGDEWKGAFICYLGSFEPTVMYFGMCNSLATFQQMMNEIFTDMTNVVIIYINDLLIFTNRDMKHHQEMVKKVLERLRKNNLFVKPEKCFFGVKKVDMLGMDVSCDRISINMEKLAGITQWPPCYHTQMTPPFIVLNTMPQIIPWPLCNTL